MESMKRRGIQILVGELLVSVIAVIVTVAFLESGFSSIVRNIVIVDLIFLGCFILWLKLFGHYEKIYKAGLRRE